MKQYADPGTASDPHYSFVVDGDGPFGYQAYVLSRSLMELAGVEPFRITACVLEDAHPSIAATLRSLGIGVERVAPFGDPYCNKIQQLPKLVDVGASRVVLLDTDTFVLAKPDFPPGNAVLGKLVDAPNPPIATLVNIFAEAKLSLRPALSDVVPGPTVEGNFNGGLYVLPTANIPEIHAAWAHWARWCLARPDLFADRVINIDQVSFAMMIADIGLATEALPRRFNTPTHLGPIANAEPPVMLHYHRSVDTQLLLLPVGDSTLDAAIASANRVIVGWRSAVLPNDLFWTARYAQFPELGSGIGSRGTTLERKRRMLSRIVQLFQPGSVVDIGGGDGMTIEGLTAGIHHAATDAAPGAMRGYLARNPQATFSVADITAGPAPEPADLAVCLDLLIHLSTRDAY
ncbi:MAG: class I SAM-dependent methyltransferase, partial [Betaproteobacteria bacterium]